ncbi:MucBP domain-containing protein [Enterococcus plantarum]|uniref:MucBP domain-containing protein n=1 Tax=Enterococcus plantarum TaxID=1077675 RepID=UPI001A9028C7|nr:MucBP domain-containing protein [Enterococcus plantarum]MBO0422391.1 MucBP domain-containing protein [Enterococcus plantarum]
MKKWTHTLLVSTIVLGALPYSAINSAIQANAEDIAEQATAEKEEAVTEPSEDTTKSTNDSVTDLTLQNTAESEQPVKESGPSDSVPVTEPILKDALKQAQQTEIQETSILEPDTEEMNITPRRTSDFIMTIDGSVVDKQLNYYYTNVSNLSFIRSDAYNVSYEYDISYGNTLLLHAPNNNIVDFTPYLDKENYSEGIYIIDMTGFNVRGRIDTGEFYNNIQRTASSVNIDGVINSLETVVENPSSITVGRDAKDTYGEIEEYSWVISGTDKDGNPIEIKGKDRQPTQEEINSLPTGDYIITNTVTEKLPDGYVSTNPISDTTQGAFKITAGKVIVEHILSDKDGNEIKIHSTDNTTYNGKIGTDYTTSPINIPGYELVQEKIPNNENGKYTAADQTVKYYYKKIITDINVEYVDTDGNPLKPNDKITNEYEAPYKTTPKDIPGYDLVDTSGNVTGIHTENDQTVSYVYKKKETKVTVNYVDEKGNPLADKDLIDGFFDDPYNTAPKEIPGYTVKPAPDNASGKHTVEPIEVTYIYTKIKTDINVEYVDENNNPISSNEKISGEYGDDYKTKHKEIPGYELVTVPLNANGTHTDKNQTVKYVYKKKKTKVTVNYVDEKGQPLANGDLINGLFDDSYDTKPKAISGYILTAVPNNASGKQAVDPTEVTYVYKKIEAPTVNDSLEGAKEVSGTGMPNSRIVVTFPNGVQVTVDVDKEGKWTVAVPEGIELKKGDKVTAVTLDPLTGVTSDQGDGKVIPSTTKVPETGTLTNINKPNYSGNTETTTQAKHKLPNTGETSNADVVSIGLLSLIVAFFGKCLHKRKTE